MENKKLAHKSIPVDAMGLKVCFVSLHSLGVALSRGHGKYFFRGNVTIEEGKMPLCSVLYLRGKEAWAPTMSSLKNLGVCPTLWPIPGHLTQLIAT